MSSFHDSILLSMPGAPADGPLRDGDGDVSWLAKCRVGDNQGSDGACSIFSIANWCEVMTGREIGNQACLDLYRHALNRFGRPPGSGLTFGEAFLMVHAVGWLPAGIKGLRRCYTLNGLASQPILAAYKVTPAWQFVNRAGSLDHSAPDTLQGHHAVLIVAHGSTTTSRARLVYIENSWGLGWGWNGIGVMTEALHRRLNVEMWEILI